MNSAWRINSWPHNGLVGRISGFYIFISFLGGLDRGSKILRMWLSGLTVGRSTCERFSHRCLYQNCYISQLSGNFASAAEALHSEQPDGPNLNPTYFGLEVLGLWSMVLERVSLVCFLIMLLAPSKGPLHQYSFRDIRYRLSRTLSSREPSYHSGCVSISYMASTGRFRLKFLTHIIAFCGVMRPFKTNSLSCSWVRLWLARQIPWSSL